MSNTQELYLQQLHMQENVRQEFILKIIVPDHLEIVIVARLKIPTSKTSGNLLSTYSNFYNHKLPNYLYVSTNYISLISMLYL